MKHLEIIVSGRVQGVYFRAGAKEVAENLGLTGYVTNRPDSTVFIEAEGEEEQLDQLIRWCRKGPERAMVSKVEVIESPVKGYSGFEIRRN